MNATFFNELAIPSPDVNLAVGSGTGIEQIAHIMLALEPEVVKRKPDVMLVVGDVNSTLASALVATKLNIPVVHVEAGLRSGDSRMPEEVNRLVVDRLSSLLLATEDAGVRNLLREGIAQESIRLVGNVMIDTLHFCLPRAIDAEVTWRETGATAATLSRIQRGFGFVTLHRPSNVEDRVQLGHLVEALIEASLRLPLIFAVHPRTLDALREAKLDRRFADSDVHITQPLSYLQTIGLLRDARIVLTDSGGLQEETTALGVPCLTLRDTTERPITIEQGTNVLVGTAPEAIVAAVDHALRTGGKRGRVPTLWDGRAAVRIAEETIAFVRRMRPLSVQFGA